MALLLDEPEGALRRVLPSGTRQTHRTGSCRVLKGDTAPPMRPIPQ